MRVCPLSCFVGRLLMAKLSAGILLYRRRGGGLELLLVHPGGPFWAKKDAGAWSIPKGEYAQDEDPMAAARRELAEETGAEPRGDLLPLGDIVQKGGKRVSAWALEGDFDPARLKSNHFELEWPPRSGRRQSFPEIDRAQWFASDAARQKILPAQADFIARLLKALGK
jgi:predicted NUDIX family NTP pyrophosphohydrolase